jgi:riboflavin kinase/FMN adenylyltransferase
MRRLRPGERMRERPVVTIGTFDGVHRGHQALMAEAARRAQELGTTWVVLTFDPPPPVVLQRMDTPFELTPLPEKLALLEALGVPAVGVLVFDESLARRDPDAFLTDVVEGWLNAAAIVEGENFTFGSGARGNAVTLKAWGQRHGVSVTVLERRRGQDGAWSSSRAREAVRAGHLAVAERILGRPYQAVGPVVAGSGRGRTIGVPTANVAVPPRKLMPPAGVYAGWAWVADRAWPAVANWGPQPTFAGAEPRLEVHLLDFSGRVDGETLRFQFLRSLRAVRRFDSPAALVAQIQEDIAMTRRVLDASPGPL